MAIQELSDDLNIIAALDDEPNDVDGLTASQLKAKFDEAGNTIKAYINDELIPGATTEVNEKVAAAELASGNVPTGGTTGQALIKASDTDHDAGWQDIPGDSAATANTLVQRDANGRAQFAEPDADADAATKKYVDDGATIIGIVPPSVTTVGADGQFYLDKVENQIYYCVGEDAGDYIWERVSGEQIGQRVVSLASSLGDKYIAAVDQDILRSEYPEQTEVMLGGYSYYTSSGSGGTGNIYIYGINYLNGYIIKSGSIYDAANTRYAASIFYSDDEGQSWTWVDISNGGASEYCYSKVIWDGTYYSCAVYGGYIAYCTTLNGTWTLKNGGLYNTPKRQYELVGDYYVCVEQYSSTNRLFYLPKTDLLTGTFTQSGQNYIGHVIYENGKYVSAAISSYRRVYYTDDLASGFTTTTMTFNSAYLYTAGEISYVNGYYFVCGKTSGGYTTYAYTQDETFETWTYVLTTNQSFSSDTGYMMRMGYFDGKYFILNGGNYAKLLILGESFETPDVTLKIDMGSDTYRVAAYDRPNYDLFDTIGMIFCASCYNYSSSHIEYFYLSHFIDGDRKHMNVSTNQGSGYQSFVRAKP